MKKYGYTILTALDEVTKMDEKKKGILSVILKLAVAAAIFTVVVLNYDRLKNLDVRGIVEKAGSIYTASAAVIGIFFLKSLLFVIPASLIYISVGMAFSPLTAVIISFIGIAVEVCATYFLGKFLGGDTVKKLISKSKKGQKLLEKDVGNRFSVIFLMRFTGLPIDFTSLFLGASGCRFLKYLGASLCGIMPRVILFTFLGDSIYEYIPMSLIIKCIIFALPVAAVIFIVKYFTDKRKKKAE